MTHPLIICATGACIDHQADDFAEQKEKALDESAS